MAIATLTSKKQITLPSELVRKWQLKPGDGLLFVWEGNMARIVPIRRKSLLELRGSVKPKRPFVSMTEVRGVAMEERAIRHAPRQELR